MLKIVKTFKFSIFYNRYKTLLTTYAFAIVKNKEIAEEIVAEAFIKLIKKQDEIDPNLSLESFCYTIVHNLCIDSLRKKKELTGYDEEADLVSSLQDDELIAEEKMIQNVENNTLRNIILNLQDDEREAITLWMNELSYEEMASIMGKTVSATKSLIYRARQNIIKRGRDEFKI